MENAIYGGRIDQDNDNCVLKTYLTRFFNPSVLSNHISGRLAHGVVLPTTNCKDDYLRLISSLPDHDMPVNYFNMYIYDVYTGTPKMPLDPKKWNIYLAYIFCIFLRRCLVSQKTSRRRFRLKTGGDNKRCACVCVFFFKFLEEFEILLILIVVTIIYYYSITKKKKSSIVISQLKSLDTSSSSTSKFNREVWKLQLGPLLSLWEKQRTHDDDVGGGPLLQMQSLQRQISNRSSSNNTASSSLSDGSSSNRSPLDSFVVMECKKAFDLSF